ncbi:hypothetical protein ASB58_08480 [Pseudomonas abyssi]|uniref:Uncharacterized protein n=2 Tax=Pseudomonas abyssi TaxID=170540 RepID=A0A395R4T2_9PSED|nr:hypothetical protein ASB58_08480 [Halopseudomonas gallaeciensis]
MTPQIPEVKEMLEAGRRYLAGSCSIQELNGYASQLATVVRFFEAHPKIKETADEWATMIYRRWNEWNDVKEPLSAEDFRTWLKDQLLN